MRKGGMAVLSGIFMVAAACRHHTTPDSRVKEFVSVPTQKEDDPRIDSEDSIDLKENFILSLVPDIKLEMTRYLPKLSDSKKQDDQTHLIDYSYYSFVFGKLSQDEFRRLKAAFHDDPLIDYNESRSYQLLDFMPPQIQAMNGLRFQSESLPTGFHLDASNDGTPREIYFNVLSNCWNMVFNVVRGPGDIMQLFYIPEDKIRPFLKDDSYSDSVLSYSINDRDDWKGDKAIGDRNKGLKPFDVILISNGTTLLHAAIYIDKELYFEKTSPDDEVNFRFTPFANIGRTYLEGEGHYKSLNIEVRRFGKKPIPRAESILSIAARREEALLEHFSSEFKSAYPNIQTEATDLSFGDTLELIVNVPLVHRPDSRHYTVDKNAFESVLRGIVNAKR